MKTRIRLNAISVFLITVLLLSIGACKGKTGVSSGGSRVVSGVKGTLPLADGKTTLSIFTAGINNWVTSFDYKDNAFTKMITDETGINFDIMGVSDADASQRLNVMMSTGDYPDIILSNLSLIDLNFYAEQGILLPLDSYDLMSYPNIKNVLEEFSDATSVLKGADGKIYALPDINECLHCIHSAGRGYYYMPFVRDNGLQAPETLDDFISYMRYVRDNDVNKNGNKNDEIPISFCADDTQNAIAYFAKAFMPFVMYRYFGLALNKGSVWEQYRDNEFRQALAYMNVLYKEGLIVPDAFTMTRDQHIALGNSTPNPVVAVALSSWPGNSVSDASPRWFELFQLSFLKGPSGQGWASNMDSTGNLAPEFMVTDKCKNPELAIAFYDYLLNFDVQTSGVYGPKGVAWGEPDPGAKSLGGGTPTAKVLIPWRTGAPNISWGQANPANRDLKYRLGEQATDVDTVLQWLQTGDPSLLDKVVANKSSPEIQYIYMTGKFGEPYSIPEEYFIPPLVMNSDDSARVADINAVLNPFKDKAFVEFIVGARDINSNTAWNAYLAELDRLNSKELVSILQKYIK